MTYATYEFYTDTYLGTAINGKDFGRLAQRASSFLDYYTMGKAKWYPDTEELKMACCALAEQYRTIEMAQAAADAGMAENPAGLKSETVGGYSRTFASAGESVNSSVNAAAAANKQLAATAMMYLAGTGMLYRGGLLTMYAPHTVTVYNVEIIHGEDFSENIINHITVLRGVFLDESKGVNVRESGLEGADAATLYIPFSIDTPGKTYLPPMAYWASEDKDAHWTLSTEGQGGTTFFVSGEVVEDISFAEMNLRNDGVYTITKVDAKNFGYPAMQHWEVGGK